MSRQFSVTIPETVNVESALQKVKNSCDEFDGDVRSGTFEKSGVEGHYKINGRDVTIILTDKPWLISWDYVQEQIEKHFK